jgi:hypothetical protein
LAREVEGVHAPARVRQENWYAKLPVVQVMLEWLATKFVAQVGVQAVPLLISALLATPLQYWVAALLVLDITARRAVLPLA